MRFFVYFAFFAAVFPFSISAQPRDLCSDVLKFEAFNKDELKHTSRMLAATRDGLCGSTFNSFEEAASYARSGGWTLDYAGLGNTLQDNKYRNGSRIDISSSAFCSSSASFDNFFQDVERASVEVDSAVEAWSSCMKQNNRPHLVYSLQDDKRGAVAEIRTLGFEGLNLKGISISPKDAASCDLTGHNEQNLTNPETPITLSGDSQSMQCRKSDDYNGFVSITVQLNQGSLGPIDIVSSDAVALEAAETQQQLSQLRRDNDRMAKRISELSQFEKDATKWEETAGVIYNQLRNSRAYVIYQGNTSEDVAIGQPDHIENCTFQGGKHIDEDYFKNFCWSKQRALHSYYEGEEEKYSYKEAGQNITGGNCNHKWWAVLCIGN